MVYSVRSDSNSIFGKANIDRWADLTNDEMDDEIDARITWAIQEAYDQINARLKGCRYVVPFTLVDSAYDPIIVTLSARLTGVLLYDSRKLVDVPDFDEMMYHRSTVERTYKQIHGGQLSLVVYTIKAQGYPRAVAMDAT